MRRNDADSAFLLTVTGEYGLLAENFDRAQNEFMKHLDPQTEKAVRTFLARVPTELKVEKAIVFGSRARGDSRPDSDADLALIFERGNEWRVVELLGGLSFDVLMDTGILVQPVPISTFDWTHPEEFPRPGFLRNVAREGIAV